MMMSRKRVSSLRTGAEQCIATARKLLRSTERASYEAARTGFDGLWYLLTGYTSHHDDSVYDGGEGVGWMNDVDPFSVLGTPRDIAHQRVGEHNSRLLAPVQSLRRTASLQATFGDVTRDTVGSVLEHVLADYERHLGGASIHVSFHDLKGDMPSVCIKGAEQGWAASVIKVPVLIAACRACDAGTLRLDEQLSITHEYALEPFDPVSLMPLGKKISVHNLLTYMIVQSDNEATNMIADRIGIAAVNRTLSDLGARYSAFGHLLTPGVPRFISNHNPTGSNLITADDCTRLLRHIADGTAASETYTVVMRQLLQQSTGKLLGRYLPVQTVLESKVGVISDPKDGADVHDIAIVNNDFALAVLCHRVGCSPTVYGASQVEQMDASVSAAQEMLHNQFPDFASDMNVRFRPLHGATPGDVIGVVGKVFHDLYYTGRVGDWK